jgi:zinc transport system substrate-binding protein
MRKLGSLIFLMLLISCSGGGGRNGTNEKIITVSIGPFKYFVDQISKGDFKVNVMVPPGSDPHTYEPFPDQISQLRKSVGYISNGYLSFEMTWLDRFYETNSKMKRLSLGDKIDPVVSNHQHEGDHVEGVDPHYWVSPVCSKIIAGSIKDFLIELNPIMKEKYENNFKELVARIDDIDKQAKELFKGISGESFMIYHPNLAYLARDYNLIEIPVEFEGKEPPPSRIKDLIDIARKENIKIIFVQKEFDTKNAKAISSEIGGEIKIIDPLSEDWYNSTLEIITLLYGSLKNNTK